ncbi:MAG: MoxR family ATPase [Acidobacteriota bacterium]
MTSDLESPTVTDLVELTTLAEKILARLNDLVLGQDEACSALLATFVAGGHALLEGVPGIGKTLLARSFAATCGLDFNRVQFTPDLMPTDVTGTNVFGRESNRFELIEGPIFTQILMADEINRTPPKTQAALLEAMQERQVTIDGERHVLDPSFFVIATQNPVEFEGTYPLPEAQLDRFLARIDMSLPDREREIELYRRAVSGELAGWSRDTLPEPVVTAAESHALRQGSRQVHVSDDLLAYLAELAQATRDSPHLELAVSPRGALALLETARAAALIEGRDYLVPDDLKRFLVPCWDHRLILTAEAELEGHGSRRILGDIASSVDVPK